MKTNAKSLLVAVTIFLVSICVVFGCTSKFDSLPPAPETPALPPLPTTLSAITLPINLPIDTVKTFLEKEIPKNFSETKTERVIDEPFLKISATTSWEVNRSNFSVVARDGLQLSSKITGKAQVTGKRLGRLLRTKLGGPLSVTASPVVNTNWRLSVPNLRITATLKTAKVRILGIWVSVRGIVQPHLNRLTDTLSNQLRKIIAENDFLEVAAKKHWQQLCRSFPLGKDSRLWMEVKPVSVHVAQPMIVNENIRLQLGLVTETRIVSRNTRPICPFPRNLIIESPRDGRVEITLPAEIDYSTLQDILSQHFVEKVIGKDVSVTITHINLRPHGDSLLMTTGVSIRKGGWLGTRAEGTLYLLARPILNAQKQTIRLVDVELDTASRNTLVAIVGEAIEPVLLDFINSRATFELQPLLGEKLQREANAAIREFGSGGLKFDGLVEDIRLVGLNVGPSYLQIVGTARAEVNATIQTIEEFGS